MTTTDRKSQAASMQSAHHFAYLENWADAPKAVKVVRVPLSSEQRGWIEKA